uniref:ABC-2 type transporter transmembrane domain-containing protein n=1 Tax=Rhipicephalus microplus TaxID=6941 RepID=A0A6G5ABR8_RHIMP
MMMSVVLAYMPSLIAVEVVEDRQNKVKNQLRVSGLLFSGYWFTVLLSHAALYLLSVLLTVLALVVLRVPFLTEPVALLAIVVLFLLYVPASLVVCYVLTHLFNKHETAKGVLPFLALLCSMFPAVPVTILDMMGSSRSATALHYTLCLLVPFYIPNGGLYYITKTSVIIETRLSNGYDADRWMFFDWDSNILVTYVACLIHTLAYYFLLRMADIGKAGVAWRMPSGSRGASSTSRQTPTCPRRRTPTSRPRGRGSHRWTSASCQSLRWCTCTSFARCTRKGPAAVRATTSRSPSGTCPWPSTRATYSACSAPTVPARHPP